MTEIEAIKEIEERVQITEYVGSSYVDCVDIEALRIAIFALKQMEKKQLPGENETSDCISRYGLKESLLSEDYEAHDYCFPCKEIMKRIDEQPSEQPDHIADGDKKDDHFREVTKKVDVISRQAAIDALHMHLMYRMGTDSNKKRLDEWINNLPSAQPERTCVNCGRTVNNGGWYADGGTRCPIEEHYALPKDGFCHLWEKRNVTDDDYPERRTDEE